MQFSSQQINDDYARYAANCREAPQHERAVTQQQKGVVQCIEVKRRMRLRASKRSVHLASAFSRRGFNKGVDLVDPYTLKIDVKKPQEASQDRNEDQYNRSRIRPVKIGG
jgi:hypothetical protein